MQRRSALGVFVVAAVACQASRDGGETTGRTTQPLVASDVYYVGTGMAAKTLALTFDDGPSDRTIELSDFLKKRGIRATFFVNGACVQATSLPNESCGTPTTNGPAILAQVAADGHLVANHSTTHRDMPSLAGDDGAIFADLSETNALVTTYGKTPWNRALFRAPYGSWNAAAYDAIKNTSLENYVGPIYWDIGGGGSFTYPADWECWQTYGRSIAQCAASYRAEMNAVGKGIVLMHDSWSETVDMVKTLVPLLQDDDGFTFVRVDTIARVAADFPACGAAGCVSCSGPAANQCLGCAAGRYLSAGTCPNCATCAAGTYRSKTCTATTNTVCTACAAGTYATGTNAASCTTCGNCNDGDACTTDTCVASSGCKHTPIAGCSADAGTKPDAGTDAGMSDAGTESDAGSATDASVDDDAGSGEDVEPGGPIDPGFERDSGLPAPPAHESTAPAEDSGCQAAPTTRRVSAWPLLAAAFLFARRRRLRPTLRLRPR